VRRQAYGEYIAANETYLKTKRDTLQAVRSNYLAVLTSAATVKARKQAITSNNSALEATRAGYDVGTRDLVDVLNAQRNLYTAQRDYYAALYTYVVSTLELREAAGILSNWAGISPQIKPGADSIVAIEFMVQWSVLAWSHAIPAIAHYSDNIRILSLLEESGQLQTHKVHPLT